jgi:hypothetical protein
MHAPHAAAVTVIVSCAIIAASGCGGSSSPKNQTSAAAAKTASSTVDASTTGDGVTPQLKASIEAICAKRNQAVAAATRSVKYIGELDTIMRQRAAIEQSTLNAFNGLSIPATLAPTWRRFIHYRRSLIKAQRVLAREGLKKDKGTELQAVGEAQKQMLAVAKRAGFTQCAQPG